MGQKLILCQLVYKPLTSFTLIAYKEILNVKNMHAQKLTTRRHIIKYFDPLCPFQIFLAIQSTIFPSFTDPIQKINAGEREGFFTFSIF